MSFDFKKFSVDDSRCAMKIGTDGVLLGSWATVASANVVRDIGAGSGLIAMMVAQRNACAKITAIEIDKDAALDCEMNFRKTPWIDRLEVVTANFSEIKFKEKVDLIVSNPPFFSEALQSPEERRAQARHGASLSPFTLIDYAARELTPTGELAMITPCREADAIIYAAEMSHLKLRRYTEVVMRAGDEPSRILWQFSRVDGHIEKTVLTLRKTVHEWADEYLALTSDFYIRHPHI